MTPESTLEFPATALPADVTSARLIDRRGLVNELARTSSPGSTRSIDGFDGLRDEAFEMIANPVLAQALDVSREPASNREKYGLTLFGQSALAARRLVEIGVKVVTVFWDTWTDNNAAWDTHPNHHPRLKDGLFPKFDQILPAFLDDMESRGLLDDTLVMVISEHGRTPTSLRGPAAVASTGRALTGECSSARASGPDR